MFNQRLKGFGKASIFPTFRTFGNFMQSIDKHRLNNFDFMRIAAASMVVFAHSFDLLSTPQTVGNNSEPLRVLTHGQMSFGSLGVAIFFCLSGYLITQSLHNSQNYTNYFAKRFLRIFPALMLDLVIAVFIWGALVTSRPLASYFSDIQTYQYLWNIFLFKLSYVLPGVFEANSYPNIVNMSLWTLPYEFICYFGVVILDIFLISRNRYVFAGFGILMFVVGFVVLNSPYAALQIGETDIRLDNFFVLTTYFAAGAIFFQFRDKIPLKAAAAGVLLIIYAFSFYFDKSSIFGYLCLPYIVFWFVFSDRIKLHKAGKFGDFSYGMYIYSFPVQQTIIYFLGNRIAVPKMIFLSFLFTIPLAMFSWFVVEKRALKLKDSLIKPIKVSNNKRNETAEFA